MNEYGGHGPVISSSNTGGGLLQLRDGGPERLYPVSVDQIGAVQNGPGTRTGNRWLAGRFLFAVHRMSKEGDVEALRFRRGHAVRLLMRGELLFPLHQIRGSRALFTRRLRNRTASGRKCGQVTVRLHAELVAAGHQIQRGKKILAPCVEQLLDAFVIEVDGRHTHGQDGAGPGNRRYHGIVCACRYRQPIEILQVAP